VKSQRAPAFVPQSKLTGEWLTSQYYDPSVLARTLSERT